MGRTRIHGELLKLGIDIGESSVSKYMVRRPKPPSQTSAHFLENHFTQLVSIDFFTVPTALPRLGPVRSLSELRSLCDCVPPRIHPIFEQVLDPLAGFAVRENDIRQWAVQGFR